MSGATTVETWGREDVEAVADCLGDDAAKLRDENDEDERAANMDRAASMLTWMLLTYPALRKAERRVAALGLARPDLLRAADYIGATNDSPNEESTIDSTEGDRIAAVLRKLAEQS